MRKKFFAGERSVVLLMAIPMLQLLLFTCSGPLSGGGSETPIVTSGRMTKGSVIVNGVEFTVSTDTSISKDSVAADESDLQDGMIVTLRGTVNDDGITGVAEKVHSEDELQGNVESTDAASNPQSLVVLGQIIYVDDLTIYAGSLAGFGSLAIDDLVEVHGHRHGTGSIVATRIEKLTSGEIELKGIVSSLSGDTFTIGSQLIDFSGAVIEPSGATPLDGDSVEAKGDLSGGTLMASELELMDLTEDPDLELSSGMEVELEGYITDLAEPSPGLFTFRVNGENVSTTITTDFNGGSAANLANDAKVEVTGTSDGSSIIAAEVHFSEIRVELEGIVSAHTATTLTIFDLTVEINDLTELPELGITDGQRYNIEAYIEGSALIAEQAESVGADDDLLQAPVEAKAGDPTWSMTMLGISFDLSDGGIEFEDENGTVLTRDAFFAAVTPGTGTDGTLIKVKGDAFAGGTIPNITKAQFEN